MTSGLVSVSPSDVAEAIVKQLDNRDLRVGFFFGAGASIPAGLPGIPELTRLVLARVSGADLRVLSRLMSGAPVWNVEQLLSTIRLLVAACRTSSSSHIRGVSIARLEQLDYETCSRIVEVISGSSVTTLDNHLAFASWLNSASHQWPVEVFTINYDLLIERAMELRRVPFFDGFVGSVRARFYDEFLNEGRYQAEGSSSWTKLWKLHGSVDWYQAGDGAVRQAMAMPGDKVHLIYPSVEKYESSRRLPFLALQDRLRRHLASTDALLLMLGYSWGDEHLNEIVLRSLESNPGLHVIVLSHGAIPPPLELAAGDHSNLTVTSPSVVVRGGVRASWASAPSSIYFDGTGGWTLGDFRLFTKFLLNH